MAARAREAARVAGAPPPLPAPRLAPATLGAAGGCGTPGYVRTLAPLDVAQAPAPPPLVSPIKPVASAAAAAAAVCAAASPRLALSLSRLAAAAAASALEPRRGGHGTVFTPAKGPGGHVTASPGFAASREGFATSPLYMVRTVSAPAPAAAARSPDLLGPPPAPAAAAAPAATPPCAGAGTSFFDSIWPSTVQAPCAAAGAPLDATPREPPPRPAPLAPLQADAAEASGDARSVLVSPMVASASLTTRSPLHVPAPIQTDAEASGDARSVLISPMVACGSLAERSPPPVARPPSPAGAESPRGPTRVDAAAVAAEVLAAVERVLARRCAALGGVQSRIGGDGGMHSSIGGDGGMHSRIGNALAALRSEVAAAAARFERAACASPGDECAGGSGDGGACVACGEGDDVVQASSAAGAAAAGAEGEAAIGDGTAVSGAVGEAECACAARELAMYALDAAVAAADARRTPPCTGGAACPLVGPAPAATLRAVTPPRAAGGSAGVPIAVAVASLAMDAAADEAWLPLPPLGAPVVPSPAMPPRPLPGVDAAADEAWLPLPLADTRGTPPARSPVPVPAGGAGEWLSAAASARGVSAPLAAPSPAAGRGRRRRSVLPSMAGVLCGLEAGACGDARAFDDPAAGGDSEEGAAMGECISVSAGKDAEEEACALCCDAPLSAGACGRVRGTA